MTAEQIIELARLYWPYAFLAVPFLLGALYGLAKVHLRGEALRAVSSAYRVAIHKAEEWQEQGILWLRGPEGVALRRKLATAAYAALPARIGPVPVGILKLIVTREQWIAWVEEAFAEVVELAEKLEYPTV